jgi:hypothetical protein
MGLDVSDEKPVGISLQGAYTAIRDWYRTNAGGLSEEPPAEGSPDIRQYAKECLPLVRALPPEGLSQLEIRAVLYEVIMGQLEWAYHRSDGQYKMAAYAHAALDEAGLWLGFSERERRELKAAPGTLLPYLSPHIIQ